MSVAELMWRTGVLDAHSAPTVTPEQARVYASQAHRLSDRCCRSYWLAYARTLRSKA
jgi:hypothetical protein